MTFIANILLFDFVVFFGTRFAFLHLYLQRNAMQTALPFLFTSRRQISIISPFHKRIINIGTDMGGKSVQTNCLYSGFTGDTGSYFLSVFYIPFAETRIPCIYIYWNTVKGRQTASTRRKTIVAWLPHKAVKSTNNLKKVTLTFKFLFLNFNAFKYFYYFIIFCLIA
jgi:hypothetical protein